MYDFSFTISYTRGCSEYTDVFIEHESLRSEAIYACMDPAEMWVLESVTGDPGELAAAEDRLLDASLDRYSITDRPCEAEKRTNLLNTERRRRVTFTHVTDASHCDAIPLIAAKYLSSGVVFKQTRSGGTATWNVLHQNDENVGLLYDAVGGRLSDGATFSFDHLTELEQWESPLLEPSRIRAEQREVLEAAVAHGYFETPRAVTLDELAAELELPRSTVSYRLRRATAELANSFVEHHA